MNLIEPKQKDNRRTLLWFLYYDADYQLSEAMLVSCFEAHGKPIARDQLQSTAQWLCEQGFTEVKHISGNDYICLTDSGLEVAKGTVRAVGVRDLLPSEVATIKAFKGY